MGETRLWMQEALLPKAMQKSLITQAPEDDQGESAIAYIHTHIYMYTTVILL